MMTRLYCLILSALAATVAKSDTSSPLPTSSDSKKTSAFAKPGDKAQSELELKLVKLWGRIDELEIRLKRQEEKILLLEKGLMLGVVPEGLIKKDSESNPQHRERGQERGHANGIHLSSMPNEQIEGHKMAVNPSAIKEAVANDTGPYKTTEAEPVLPYKDLIKDAQHHFSKGDFGRAINLYEQIKTQYPERNLEAQCSYWIGLSWFYLKEFDLADENFAFLLKAKPDSPWAANARLYTAKILVERGLFKPALQSLKEIIEAYPNTDTSEMAQYEISVIRKRI